MYMLLTRHQNSDLHRDMKTGNRSLRIRHSSNSWDDRIKKNGVFLVVTPCGSCKNRRFGGTWRRINLHLIHEEIKRRLDSGNACNHSVQNLLPSRMFSKGWTIKIHRTVMSVVLYGCETWSLKLREEHRLKNVWEWGAQGNVCTEKGWSDGEV
jgi:hypothetical protein